MLNSPVVPMTVLVSLGAVAAALCLFVPRRQSKQQGSSEVHLAASSRQLEHEGREYLKFLRTREQEVLTRTEPGHLWEGEAGSGQGDDMGEWVG